MNLYDYHNKPESLIGHARKYKLISAKEALKALHYKRNLTPAQILDAEHNVARDTKHSFLYAADILGGAFPAGEAAIAEDPKYAFLYARDVIGKPFPAGEAAIATDVYYAVHYAKSVIKKPFTQAEATLAASPIGAYDYVSKVLLPLYRDGAIKSARFPAGEAVIARNAEWAEWYAC
jgi:hypothetical protein